MLQEAINGAKERAVPVYIEFLDAKTAFGVVAHSSLSWKLYLDGVVGDEWRIQDALQQNSTSAVKWKGKLSQPFKIQQGVY
jgi:hypothetical protein